jgi:hypothetical protein
MTDTPLDTGILAYLQRGVAASPRSDTAAVLAISATEGEALLRQVKAVVTESLSVPVDWPSTTLADAGRHVSDVMRERHPELGQDALDALAWNVTYEWR